MEGEEGAWEGRLCEVVGGERVDVKGVQKPHSQWTATADEEDTLIGASATGGARVEVGSLWREVGGKQETTGG